MSAGAPAVALLPFGRARLDGHGGQLRALTRRRRRAHRRRQGVLVFPFPAKRLLSPRSCALRFSPPLALQRVRVRLTSSETFAPAPACLDLGLPSARAHCCALPSNALSRGRVPCPRFLSLSPTFDQTNPIQPKHAAMDHHTRDVQLQLPSI